MSKALPIETMTVADKLAAIEQLWNDLTKEPQNVPSPEWHADVLRDRAEKVRRGDASFSILDDVKSRLQRSR